MPQEIKITLDELDIENAIREYCENVFNISFKGMEIEVGIEEGVSFPEGCYIVGMKPLAQPIPPPNPYSRPTTNESIDEDIPF